MIQFPETYTGPGLVDLQVNGYAGLDFNGEPGSWTAEQFRDVAEALASRGVVAAVVTIITDDIEAMLARARRYRRIIEADADLAVTFPRLHVEGPFICPADGPRGAHPRQHCKAPGETNDLIDRLNDASGQRVGIVTLAPELSGAIDLIARLAEDGICPAIGHTQASPGDIAAAAEAGARLSTHLGNGSHSELPRLDNYIQSQLADDRLSASFIADGHHMPFTTLKNFIRAKTPAMSILVTDAISATELGPGNYELGGCEVVVLANGKCIVPGADHLAGSTLTLDRGVINVCRHCGVSFQQAWRMASSSPAALLGIETPEITVEVAAQRFIRR